MMEETVTFMDDDPISSRGLRPVELTDQATLTPYFRSLAEPLSDYTFSQLFTWRNSLRILWKVIEGHLCVFANGTGDLTLLMPPIGDSAGNGAGDRALRDAFDIMDDYNAAHGAAGRSKIEYASEELLARFDHSRLDVKPMGNDYVYDVHRMIDLAGGDLASKRQAKNRFLRNYAHRVEHYDAARHRDDCLSLLRSWQNHQDCAHAEDGPVSARKRQKELLATELTLSHAPELGLLGMVVYVDDALRGFTFGETLSARQSSIVIEKTHLQVKGLAQFIFSDFCQRYWSQLPLVNVGDDWGLQTLAWTKLSYRPVKLLQKYAIAQSAPVCCAAGAADRSAPLPAIPFGIIPADLRPARKEDLPAAVELEQSCFSAHCLTKRQLNYLQGRPSALFFVAEQSSQIIGEGIALVRRHKSATSGRIYSLAVHPSARGQKIRRRLMEQLVDSLKQRGVRRIYLEVETHNTPAIALYKSFGFRSIGLLENYYGTGKHALHMLFEATDLEPVSLKP